MNSLAPNLRVPDAEVKLSAMLQIVAEHYQADYVYCMFAPSGTNKYGCTLSYTRSDFVSVDTAWKLKSFAENAGKINQPTVFSSDEVCGFAESDEQISEYLFYPLSAGNAIVALLILARKEGAISRHVIPEKMRKDFMRVTAAEITAQHIIREQIYAACRQLADVKDELRLEQIVRKSFNPLFDLAGSGILLLRKSHGRNVYLFLTDPGAGGDLLRQDGTEEFQLISDTGKFQGFFNKFGKLSLKTLINHVDLDKDSSNAALFPFLQNYADKGISNFTIITLVNNNELIGYWLMAYNKGISPALYCNEAYQITAEHLSAAVTAVKVHKSLKDKAGEVEILQWLNQLLATSRDRKGLIRTIRSRLENMFSFSHSFICDVNEDDITVNILLSDSQTRAQFHPRYEEMKESRVTIADGFLNQVILTTEPVVFDLEKLNQTRKLPIYMSVNFESGVKKMLMLSLRINTNVIGIWMICFTDEQPVLPKYLDLVKILAAPISLAVANIRMENSLRERDAERDGLMSLSSDITSVKSRENLKLVLSRHVSRLLGTFETAVFVLSDEGAIMSFLEADGKNILKSARICGCGDNDCSCNPLISRFFNSTDVNVADISEFTKDPQFHAFFIDGELKGVKSVAVITLKNDGRQTGVLCVSLRSGEAFSDHQLTLLKEISYQVSKAVSNILANEELARREWEKGLLLDLSKDLASVRQKEQLIDAAKRTLKAALGYSHIALCLKTEHRIISYALDPDSRVRNHPGYKAAIIDNIPFNDAWVKIFEEAELPVTIKRSGLAGSPEISPIMQLNLECGINEMIVAKLYNGLQYFGYWVIFSERESNDLANLKLIQSAANQLSTALLNVLANREIADRDDEKEYLIQLGNAMAGIRSYSEFYQFVDKEFGVRFGYDESSIIMLEPDSEAVIKVLGGRHTMNIRTKLNENGNSPAESPGSRFFTALAGLPSTSVLSIDDTHGTRHGDLACLFSAEEGLEKAMITKFFHRNRLLGLWIMYFSRQMQMDGRKLRLMDSVGSQLSLVMENIFADEKEALFASQKSILFSFSQHVSAARNFTSLLRAIAEHIKPVLGYCHTNINLLEKDKISFLVRQDIVQGEGKKNSDCSVVNIASLPEDPIAQAMLTTEPCLFDLLNHDAFGAGTTYLDGFSDGNVSHVLLSRLEVNGEILGLWVICYEERPAIDQDYLNLVKGIRDTLSLASLNIVLNEKIKRREHEKSALLDFSRAVAGVKDKFQLGHIFHTYLKNLCNLDELCLHWLDDARDVQYCYLWDAESAYAEDPDFEKVSGKMQTINDGIFDMVLATRAPVHVDINKYLVVPDAPFYLKFFKKHGHSTMVAVPIFKGEDIVAVLFLKQYDLNEEDQALFRSLSSQLVIAVSDLIATDRVVRQLAEINRYKERLEEEKVYLTQELEISHNYSEIIGKSPLLEDVFKMISRVALSDSTVLILGETGTGKELIARAIHNDSSRKNSLMVKVNCAALPANLIESELFGHEKGSFTGATERRLGKFELANGGTLFLDEIGEMPPELQVKLLRVLQEKEIERIGGNGTIKVDVRVVAATNRDLEQEINAGRFRSDLYFRISTFPIQLPALRERIDDIPLLALHFARRFAKRAGKIIENISSRAMNELVAYSWPGNVRELEHQIERCVLMTAGSTIKEVHLPLPPQSKSIKDRSPEKFQPGTFDDFEKDYIVKTLKYCNGKVSGTGGAAEVLGIPSSTLTSRMKRLNITKKFLEKELTSGPGTRKDSSAA